MTPTTLDLLVLFGSLLAGCGLVAWLERRFRPAPEPDMEAWSREHEADLWHAKERLRLDAERGRYRGGVYHGPMGPPSARGKG